MDVYKKISRFYKSASVEKRVIGKSLLGRNIYAVKLGDGFPVGIAVYAIHGREWLTSYLALEHFRQGVVGSVWLVPLANPDGALLSQKGIGSALQKYDGFLSAYSGGELRLWKSNVRGVDLNVNFDAEWGKGVKNVRRRGAENYIGESPFSEPETRALRDFTLDVSPSYTVSFHTKGEEIYWYFGQSPHTCLRDFTLAQAVSVATGYPLRQTVGSVGGYKDWCISALQIPALTVECGNDEFRHPLGICAWSDVKKRCAGALWALSVAAEKTFKNG